MAVQWIHVFIRLSKHQMLPFTSGILVMKMIPSCDEVQLAFRVSDDVDSVFVLSL